MDKTPIPRLLLKLAPPVIFSLLIQSVYNLVDSFFVGRYSSEGLTALSIIYPLQLLMTALATGTGAGAGILVSRSDGSGDRKAGEIAARVSIFLSFLHFLLFTAAGLLLLESFLRFSSSQPVVLRCGQEYGQIVLLFSLGNFLLGSVEKLLQAKGKMLLPMAGQITGALVNILLDPLLIFGAGGIPALGLRGAAIATVIGQWFALLVTLPGFLRTFPAKRCRISPKVLAKTAALLYRAGAPSMLMQSLCTLYVVGLNLILKTFTEDAVTVLGIYYKLQTFFFIPLMGLQQVILPIVSHNHGAGNRRRTSETLRCAIVFSTLVMTLASAAFIFFPRTLIRIFSDSPAILTIGAAAFPIIGLSFIPAAGAIMLTVYFQGTGMGKKSMLVTLLRQVFLLVPLAYLLHFFGLTEVWLTFPLTEVVTLLAAVLLFRRGERQYTIPSELQI